MRYSHAIVGVDGVASLGRHEVYGIVAPVVAVGALDGGDGGLLLLAVGREAAEIARGLPGALVLIDAGDVEGGENVDRLETAVGQRAQVSHAVRIEVGEGVIGAAVPNGHRGIADAEVADVEFIDAEVVEATQRGRRQEVPRRRFGFVRIEIGDTTLRTVDCDVDGIRIAGHVGVDCMIRRDIDLHTVEVIHVTPGRVAVSDPDAVVRVHGKSLERCGVAFVLVKQE